MRKLDVVYSMSSGSAIRKALEGSSKYIRIEAMANEQMAVWVDKDTPASYNYTVLLSDACMKLATTGNEPYIVTHNLNKPIRDAVIDFSTGEFFIQKTSKQHHEVLNFEPGQKRQIGIRYWADSDREYLKCGVENIYLVGTHYEVRKVKRYLINQLTNGKDYLTSENLTRANQLIGNGRIYILTSSSRVIDCKNQNLLQSGGFTLTSNELRFENTVKIVTGKFLERVYPVTVWDSVIKTADK